MAEKQQADAPEFNIERIYIKDVSFEAPGVNEVFREQWVPKVNLELNTKSSDIEDEVKEVVLELTVTAKKEEKVIFLAEVQQAGRFIFKNFADDQLKHMLGAFCPNILFPYAREAISDLVQRGGFPHLYLAPINFDALYQQFLEKEKATEQ